MKFFFFPMITSSPVIGKKRFFRSFWWLISGHVINRGSQKIFLPHIFFQVFTCKKAFVAILSSSPSRNHNGETEKKRPWKFWKCSLVLRDRNHNCIDPYILLDPLCTFLRLHTHRLTKASQSQARIQKRAAANTFKHRYNCLRLQNFNKK